MTKKSIPENDEAKLFCERSQRYENCATFHAHLRTLCREANELRACSQLVHDQAEARDDPKVTRDAEITRKLDEVVQCLGAAELRFPLFS